jgi:hypothetical protein
MTLWHLCIMSLVCSLQAPYPHFPSRVYADNVCDNVAVDVHCRY